MSDPSTSSSFTDIWDEAFKTYQEQTGRKLNHDTQLLKKLRSSDDLLREIEASSGKFDEFRAQHGKLWSALDSCLKPLDLLGHTLQSAVTSAPFAPAVFASVLHLVKACNNVSDSYDYLVKIFTELEGYTVRLQEYMKGGMVPSLRKKTIGTLAFALEIIGRSEKLIKTGRFRQFLSASIFGNEKMKTALEKLKTLVESEERLVIALTYSSTQQTNQAVSRTEQKVDASARVVEEMKTAQQSARSEEKKQADEKIIRDLLDSPAIDKIRDIFSECTASIVPGSGMWIQDEPLFDAWMEREAPILWVFGGPGAGKSYLATRIITDLRMTYPQDVEHPSSVAVAYFYVKEDDQHLHDLNTILKSIAFQISIVDPIFKKHILTAHTYNESLSSPRSTWENLFLRFFGSKSNFDHSAFIVIDGLDEAPPRVRKEFLEILRTSLVDSASATTRPRMQFAILGRPELKHDIRFSHGLIKREKSIAISSSKNHDDIDRYIQEGLKKVMILYRMRPPAAKKFAKQIRDTILAGADGMFLWAKLILAQIYEKERKSEILDALNNAPRELDGMIHHVFERLERDPDVNHADLNRILEWISCARRPLLLGELDVILRIPSGEGNLALRDRLRGKLASIFTLSRLQGAGDAEDDGADEPTSAVTAQPPTADFLSFDSEEESTVVGGEDEDGDDGEAESGSRNKPDEDLALDPRLQKEFANTQVVFAHKRIKDYIVQASFHFSPTNPQAIGVDIQKAEMEITTTLLSILCDEITKGFGGQGGKFNLVSYAAENFMKHLEEIDLMRIGEDDRKDVTKLLMRLFREEGCIKRFLNAARDPDEERLSDRGYNEFFHTWLVTNRYTQLVRKWFRTAGELERTADESLEEEQRDWIRQAGHSAKELFRPLMMVAASFWLTKTGADDIAYLDKSEFKVWLLHAYFILDDEGVTSEDFSDFQLYSIAPDRIPLARMVELAEFGKVEKTEHWYTGLAWIMMEAGYYSQSMENFRHALDINPNLWVAMEGLARCLGSVWRREEAIQWMEKGVQSLPSSLQGVAVYLWPRITEWKLELGDIDGAIEAAKSKLEWNYFDFQSNVSYLSVLHQGRRFAEILELLKGLDQNESSDFTRSQLVQMISYGLDIYEPIGLAAASIGGSEGAAVLEIMRNAIDDGMIAADTDTDNRWPSVMVRIFGGNFNYRYLNNLDVATVFWESGLQLIADHFGDTLQYNCISERSTCSTHLSEVFFHKAVEAKKQGGDYEPWIAKLQRLSTFANSLLSEGEYRKEFGTGYSSRLYGIWLREHEKVEESRWKECFRPSVLESIDLLNDEDPNNDEWGYSTLARTLLHAGDVENGVATLTVTLKGLEASQAERARSQEVKPEEASSGVVKSTETPAEESAPSTPETVQKEGEAQPVTSKLPRVKLSGFSDDFWNCDGPCNTPCHAYRELHFCIICNDTCFCEKCILLVKGSASSGGEDQSEPKRLPYRHCSPDHTFVHAYPIGELGKKNLAATIREGYVELHQEWLMSLKEQWTK